jgi:hypothetical protein
MAAPHISGLASVLLAQNNNLIQEDFLSLVKSYPITLLNN